VELASCEIPTYHICLLKTHSHVRRLITTEEMRRCYHSTVLGHRILCRISSFVRSQKPTLASIDGCNPNPNCIPVTGVRTSIFTSFIPLWARPIPSTT